MPLEKYNFHRYYIAVFYNHNSLSGEQIARQTLYIQWIKNYYHGLEDTPFLKKNVSVSGKKIVSVSGKKSFGSDTDTFGRSCKWYRISVSHYSNASHLSTYPYNDDTGSITWHDENLHILSIIVEISNHAKKQRIYLFW